MRISTLEASPSMAKQKTQELDFDLKKAIKRLHREALAAGALPKDHPHARSPFAVADAHQHGVGPVRCAKNPCRLAGLCLALYEVIQYKHDVEHLKPVIEAARQTEQVRNWLGTSGSEYVAALTKLLKYAKKQHAHAAASTVIPRTHEHALLCVQPARVLHRLTALLASLENFDDRLRKIAWSRTLHQRSDQRRADLLLQAVWQHLDWGGLTYEEIFELVPSSTKPANVKDAVRDRVRKGRRKARSLFPRELHPKLATPPTVSRARRRRSKVEKPKTGRSST